MSDRLVYFGEFKNHKKEQLIDKAIEMLKDNKGHKFYYLLPNGSLLKNFRERFVKETSSAFHINLFTFDDIVQNILKDNDYLLIDNIWKSFIISQILEELSRDGKIPYYKNISSKQGFIESINFIIGEIKRSLVGPQSFISNSPNRCEFLEIGLIYKEYENYMDNKKLMDREGSYLKALELLKNEDNNFQDIEFIIIDEFYDFRPIEIEILKLMTKSQVDIYINMPFKMDYQSEIINNTILALKSLDFKIEDIKEKEDDLFMDLGRGFFDYDSNKLKSSNKVGLIDSASSYLEIKKVFTIIKKLHLSGIPLNDLGIVALSDSYKEKLIRVSIEEEIPLAIGIQTEIIKIPFVRELLASLEDNYKGDLKDIKINNVDSLKNYHLLVLDLIEKKKIKEKIKDTYSRTDDFQIYRRDLLAFSSLISILDNIQKIESLEGTLEFTQYLEIFSAYLGDEKIYLKDENLQGVNIMDPLNSRGFQYHTLFVVGLCQSEYPILKSNNFLIRDENAEILKDIGIKYWDYSHRLDNEVVKFASLISNAREKLYLSYSSEGQGIGSMFLEEILDRFEEGDIKDKLDYTKLELDYIFKNDLHEINTKDELANYLLLSLDKDIDEKYNIFALYNHLDPGKLTEINEKLQCEYSRTSYDFNEYRGKISDTYIANEIKDSHREKIYSATYLESYSRCPFAFFMKNILNLEEDRSEEEYNALEIGSIYHEVLKSYYIKYRDSIEMDIRGQGSFNISETLDYLKKQVFEQARFRKLDIEKMSSTLVLKSMYINLRKYIEHDIQRLAEKDQKMIPVEFELGFGISSVLSLDIEGKVIQIMGRIDRLDKLLHEDKYIVIDYKSGSSGIYGLEDMREGLSLQIPLYILSQREKNIVLGIYGQIKKAKSQIKIGLIDQLPSISISKSAAINSEERDELLRTTEYNIKNIVENIEAGDFSVNPKECSPYCPYKEVCRYDRSMEVEI